MKIKSKIISIVTLFIMGIPSLVMAQTQLYKYVDPFIGAEGDGNVTIGPSCPFGMVKPGPDCDLFSNSGYRPDLKLPVLGFSQVHVSGTGGGAKYGNISVMPYIGDLNSINQVSLRSNETTALGYYSVLLKKHNIKTEITASHKVAIYKFQYNASGEKSIKVDAGFFLGEGCDLYGDEAQYLVGSEIEILSDKEISGYSRVRGGWNGGKALGKAYTVFFHVVFDKPFKNFKTWKAEKLSENKIQIDSGEKTGALLNFENADGNTIQMKVGISFLSTRKAQQNIENEVPNWNFEETLAATQQKWEQLLSKIEIDKNATDKKKKMFYTGLYHSMLMPVDRTGENPLWKSDAPYYDDFYAIWDTYRSSHPLITIIDSKRQADIINSLIDIYQHEGYMPDARSGNSNGRTQGGSNCDVLIADAFVKKLKGIDYKLALSAMLKNANVSPGGNEEKEGRGGLNDYNSKGYVSIKFPRSGTRTVEYSYNDFCIATVAKGLGEENVFARFALQAGNWQNLWRNYAQFGSTGFVMPRDENGNWVNSFKCSVGEKTEIPYTPTLVEYGQCVLWWNSYMYEASSWEYSLAIPHDVAGLINRSGGKQAFENRLNTFFEKKLYNVGNEPSFLSPTLYHWIGKPELSSERIYKIITSHFNETAKGIPGNDDSGAMSSWLAFHMLGIYPNAGQSYYLINTPFFTESEFHLDNGKSFKIIANKLSTDNKYIKSATLNKKPLSRAWLEHSEMMEGGILELEMANKPSGWGADNLPPSLKYN
jgi:predicted alpha-1,2-mannosidase